MNTTHSASHRPDPSHPASVRPAPGFRDASMHDLFVDCCRIGPAPTRSRELFVLVVTAVLVGIVFVLVAPSPGFIAVASLIVAAVMAGRWMHGTRTVWVNR